MTPRPRNATFAIISSLQYPAARVSGRLYAAVIAKARPCRQPVIALTGTARRLRCPRLKGGPTENEAMAVTKEQVLAALNGVASPAGIPLPQTGTLSEV